MKAQNGLKEKQVMHPYSKMGLKALAVGCVASVFGVKPFGQSILAAGAGLFLARELFNTMEATANYRAKTADIDRLKSELEQLVEQLVEQMRRRGKAEVATATLNLDELFGLDRKEFSAALKAKGIVLPEEPEEEIWKVVQWARGKKTPPAATEPGPAAEPAPPADSPEA